MMLIEHLGAWQTKTKVAGSPLLEYHFGTVRVARVVSEIKTKIVRGVEKDVRMFQYRILLPGLGIKDVGFCWTLDEAKEEVEDILENWLGDAGIRDALIGAVETVEAPEAFVVLEGLCPTPPKSATILPLESWRREGTERPKEKTYQPWDWPEKKSGVKALPKKASHGKRRALTRGQ